MINFEETVDVGTDEKPFKIDKVTEDPDTYVVDKGDGAPATPLNPRELDRDYEDDQGKWVAPAIPDPAT